MSDFPYSSHPIAAGGVKNWKKNNYVLIEWTLCLMRIDYRKLDEITVTACYIGCQKWKTYLTNFEVTSISVGLTWNADMKT